MHVNLEPEYDQPDRSAARRRHRLNAATNTRLVRRLRRRGWIVVLCTSLSVILAVLLAASREASWSTTALLVVPSGTAEDGPGRAAEAARLANSYAAILERDDGVSIPLGDQLQRSRTDIEHRLDVSNIQNTAVLEITYEGTTPQEAAQALNLFIALVAGPDPAPASVAPNSLIVARQANQPEAARRLPALPLGLVAGFLLGLGLVELLERADPRIDDLEDLQPWFPYPVTALREADDAVLLALTKRWQPATDKGRGISLLPVLTLDRATALGAAARLRTAADSTPVSSSRSHGTTLSVSVQPTNLERVARGIAEVTPTGACVLVLTEGSPRNAVRGALRGLDLLAIEVRWALLARTVEEQPASGEHGRDVTPDERDVGAAPDARILRSAAPREPAPQTRVRPRQGND